MNFLANFIIKYWIIWNVALAIVPYIFWSLAKLSQRKSLKSLYYLNLLVMFLFLPNSIYLTTDLVHIFATDPSANIYDRGGTPLQFWELLKNSAISPDLGNLLSMLGLFLIGIVLFYSQTQLLFKEFKPKIFFQILYFGVISFGIYLGRFVRLNSWDIFTAPLDVLGKLNPGWQGLVFILGFSLFEMLIFYGLQFQFMPVNNRTK